MREDQSTADGVMCPLLGGAPHDPAVSSTGVCPRCAQVRAMVGTMRNPVSSRKPRWAPSYAVFLSWALMLEPVLDGGLITPGHASASRHWQEYSERQIPCGSRSGSASASTCWSHALPPVVPCSRCSEASSSPAHSAGEVGRAKVEDEAPVRHVSERVDAIGRPSSTRHLCDGPQPDRGGQPSRGGSKVIAASRGSEVNRGVS